MREWLRENLRLIIAIVVVIIIAGSIFCYANRTKEIVDDNDCERYRHWSVERIPAMCLNYFQTNDTRRITR